MPFVCTLIGDLVGSRRLPDRRAAHDALRRALDRVNDTVAAVQPLEPTVGDEIQGAYSSVGDATLAGLLVRLSTLPEVDLRIGLGVGRVTVIDAERRPLIQDGPGWWAAREALDVLAHQRPSSRTAYVGPGQEAISAFLLLRDAMVDRLGDRGHRLLAGSLAGLSQRELARIEGIGESAVSGQFARGVGAVRDAQVLFGSVSWPVRQLAEEET